MLFNALNVASTTILEGNSLISFVKVQSKEWNFDEGSGNATVNNEADITTLNSDADVNDMWIQTN